MEQIESKQKLLDDAQQFQEKQKQKGVCYLSKVPPYLSVSKLRELLNVYDVERIYLTKEDRKRKFRVKIGGNKNVKYTEGWIEFKDKKVARMVGLSLNTTKIINKKRSFYGEDLWCIKYLPKFKWENLTEKLAYDSKVRKEKLNLEIKKENKKKDFYVQKIEQSKKIMGIINKVINDFIQKRKKYEANDFQELQKSKKVKLDKDKPKRNFKQKSVMENQDVF